MDASGCGAKKKMPRQDSWWERNYETAKVYAEKRKILSEKNARESIRPPFKAQPMPGFPVPNNPIFPKKITVPRTPEVLKHSASGCGAKKKMPRRNSWWERNYETAKVYAEKRKSLSEEMARESIKPPFKAQPMPGFPVPKKQIFPLKITVPRTPEVLKHSGKKQLTTEAAKQGGSTNN